MGQVLVMAGVLLGSSGNVWADVWGYIDAKGVAHFAAERVDERYELFFRGNNVPDPSRGAPESAPATPRPVAVPTAPPKLIAFFEVSPQYRQVKHHVREASRQYRIDYELLQALIATESGFDAEAVSPKGAVGLMQITAVASERYATEHERRQPVPQRLLLLLLLAPLAGCNGSFSPHYYWQAAGGQLELWRLARPVGEVGADDPSGELEGFGAVAVGDGAEDSDDEQRKPDDHPDDGCHP